MHSRPSAPQELELPVGRYLSLCGVPKPPQAWVTSVSNIETHILQSVERQLQERMIGATVLMVVAVLVVPELLSGPKPTTPPSSIQAAAVPSVIEPTPIAAAPTLREAPIPTRPVSPPIATPVLPSEPPALMAPPAAKPAPVRPPINASQPKPVVASVTKPAIPAPAPRAEPKEPKLPAKPASEKRVAGKGAWSVQVGSYAKSSAAERVAKDLQNKGFDAVILPVELQGKRLYRVRVGPATDRKTADQTLRRVQRVMPSSRLVGNP